MSIHRTSSINAMLVALLSLSQLVAASIDIRLSNNNTFGTSSRGSYNIDVSNTDNGGVTGGIVVLITEATVDHDYKVYVQYHTGAPANSNQWFSQQINEAGNTKISIGTDGTATQYIPHAAIEASDDWQGTDYDGNVTWIIVNDDLDDDDEPNTASGTQHYETYDFDMIAPTISNQTISAPKDAPFNQTYPHYAKEGDQIKMTFTSDEAISTLTGNFHGNSNISAQNLDSTSPYATINAVNTMPDGSTVTFSFILKDSNGNSATISSTENSSSVITDFTAPDINNGTTYYTSMITGNGDYFAKSGDNVVLSIKASETLVQGNFDNNNATDESAYMVFNVGTSTNVTVTPALSGIAGNNSSEFTSTVTVTDDNETSNTYVDFSITGIYDRAGNETAITDDVPTINDRVYYDSTDPTIEEMSHSTPANNANPNPYRAKNGDAIKLTFAASEVLDYNWDDNINTQPALTFQGGGGSGNSFNANTIASVSNLQNFTATLNDVAGLSEGQLNFSLAFRDRSGNQATAHTALTNESTRITIDNSAPTIDNLTIASNSTSNTAFAKPGERVTITIDVNEELRNLSQYEITDYDDGVAGTIGGIEAEATMQGGTGGQVWILSAIMGDSHPEGLLEFSATLTDMAGNTKVVTQADITSGTSVTYDKTAPTIVSASIQSNNDNTTWAKVSDVVTLIFEVNENLKEDPTVSIAGGAATKASVNVRTYTYTITVDSDDHEENILDTNPNANFTIDFTNEANIAGTQYTHASDGVDGTVTIDYTPPTLTNVYIKSDNTVDTSYARSGSNVTLKFKGVDALSSGLLRDDLIVTFDTGAGGASLNATENGDNTNASWTATAELGAGVLEQALTFSIAGFKDLAGNVGTTVTDLSGGLQLTYDQTAPTLSALTMASNNSNSNQLSKVDDAITMAITVNSTVEPNGIQLPVVTIANRSSADGDVTIRNAANDGNASQGDLVFTANYTMQDTDTETDSIEFQVAFTDLAGNVGTAVASLINDRGVSFDKTAPDFTNTAINSSVTIVSNNANGDPTIATVNDVITLTLTSAEALKAATEPTVTILGVSANVSADADNKVFTATHTVTGNEAGITNNQVIYFNVDAGYTDPTGNAGSAITQTAASFANATLRSTDGSYVLYDITAPVFDPVRIKSSNANDSTLAIATDVITLTMISDTPIKAATKPTISIAGNVIPDDDITRVGNTKFVATYAMQNNANDNTYNDPDIVIPISVTNYDDAAGNTGSAVTNTSDPANSYVVYDNTNPDLQQVTIASNLDEDDPSLAIPGSTITLQFIADEVIQEPTVTIVGRPPDNLAGSNGNKTWTATIVMLEDDSDAADPIPFAISYSDLAGNNGSAYDQTGTTDGSSISFDKTKPTLSAIYMVSESPDSKDSTYINPGNNLSIRFKVSEPLAALDIYMNAVNRGRYPTVADDAITITKLTEWNGTFEKWKAVWPVTDGTDDDDGAGVVIPFTIDFTDLNGYSGDQVTETTDDVYVTYDKTEPSVQVFTYLSNNNTTTLAKADDIITASLTASELIQQPSIKISTASVDESAGDTDRSWTATKTLNTDDEEGQVELKLVTFKDYAGNVGRTSDINRTTTTNDLYVTFDKTKPVLTKVNVYSDNNYSSNTMARVQDIITIEISTGADGELISSPTVSMIGNAQDVTITPNTPNAVSDQTWFATKTVVTNHSEGEVAFSITCTDLAGNDGDAVAVLTNDADNTNVIIDRTKTDLSALALDMVDDSDTGIQAYDEDGNLNWVGKTDNLTSVQAPTFSISGLTSTASASGDSIYLIIDNGTAIDTTIRSKVNSNEMNFTVPANLASQLTAYSATIVTKDLANNISDPTTALKFRIDTDPPALGNAPDLIAIHDTGFTDDDDVTNNRKFTLEIAGLVANKQNVIDIYYDAESAGVNNFLVKADVMMEVDKDTPLRDGSDTIWVSRSLPDDEYTFSYTVTDSAGNVSAKSANTVITVDRTVPSTPGTPDLTVAADKGTSNSDNLTNLETIIFNVTSMAAGDSVHIINSGNAIVGRGFANGQTSAEVTIAGITEASSSDFKAYAIDQAGNISSSSINALSVVIDQTAPYVDGIDLNGNGSFADDGESSPMVVDLKSDSDTGTSATDNLTNNNKPSFTLSNLTATDSVFLYFNDDSIKGYATGTSHEFTIPDIQELTDGTYNFVMKARDYAGNLSAISTIDGTNIIPVTIDTTPFTITTVPDMTPGTDTGIFSDDEITNNRAPTFSMTGLPATAEIIQLYVDGDLSSASTKNADVTTHEFALGSNLDEGTYDITFKIVDAAGNASAASEALSITIDFTAPSDPGIVDLVDADDTGISNTDNLTKRGSMQIASSGLTEGDYGNLYRLDAADNLVLVEQLLVGASGSLSYTATNEADGVYRFYTSIEDVAGNKSNNSDNITITVDQTATDVSLVEIDLDIGSDTGRDTADNLTNDKTPTFTINNTVPGDSILLVFSRVCIDQAGNDIPGCDASLPAAPNDTLKGEATGTSISLVGTALQIDNDLPDGLYTLSVFAKDDAGNYSTASPEFQFNLDTHPEPIDTDHPDYPALPIPDLMAAWDKGLYDNDNITNHQTPRILMENITDYDYYVRLYVLTGIQNRLVAEKRKVFNQDTVSLKIPNATQDMNGDGNTDAEDFWLVEGQHTIRYTIEDDAGNVSDFSQPLVITIDVTKPTALGQPDLVTLDDIGESDSDNLTAPLIENGAEFDNQIRINVDDGNALPGYKWVLYSFVDIDGDGNYAAASDANLLRLDSSLVPGGRYEKWYWNNIPNGLDIEDLPPADSTWEGVSDRDTVGVPTTGDYYYTTQQVDSSGNRSDYSSGLQITTDFDVPTYTIAYEEGGNASDLLVRFEDGTFDVIVDYSEPMDDLVDFPTISFIRYNNEDNIIISDATLSKVANNDQKWTYAVPVGTIGLEENNGPISLLNLIGKDRAGNALSFSDAQVIMDNNAPQFTQLFPASGSFNNILNNFGWTLSEDIISGSVTFTNSIGNVIETITLSNGANANELNANPAIDNHQFNSGDPNITEDTYTVTFIGTDQAGNIGETLINNYTYDITPPTAQLSFSQLFASVDTVVTVFSDFIEDMSSTPQISINFQGDLHDIALSDMYKAGSCDCLDDEGVPIPDCIDDSFLECEPSGGSWQEGEDASLWAYDFIVPPTNDNNGGVHFELSASDLATNALDSDSTSNNYGVAILNNSRLVIDNVVAEANFSYQNLSNPNLNDYEGNPTTIMGAGGDNIRITIQLNESMSPTAPIPTMNAVFGGGNENATQLTEIAYASVDGDGDGVDNNYYIFDLTLPDLLVVADGDTTPVDDGLVAFEFIAKDRANNFVTTQNDSNVFTVDNIHPADFATGLLSVHGINPVEGWITGIIDSVGIQLPIPSAADDISLYEGGEVHFQFKNLTRGLFWQTVALEANQTDEQFKILASGDDIQFYRHTSELYNVMTQGDDIIGGDSLAVRGVIIDRYGNTTYGTPSTTRLAYDPSAPVIGEIVIGNNTNFGTTIFSNDTAKVDWTPFIEVNEFESGLDRYEIQIERFDNLGASDDILVEWVNALREVDTTIVVVDPESGEEQSVDTVLYVSQTKYSNEFLLEHKHRYIASIRAFDVAGNISDLLLSDTLIRFNTAPDIQNLQDAVLFEDNYWIDSVQLVDPDLTVLQGDSFTYVATTSRIVGDEATGEVSIDENGYLTWTPTQDDTGSYTIEVLVTDNYDLKDTLSLPLTVTAVNDTPNLAILDPDNTKTWDEDQEEPVTINLSRYITDVDNEIATEIDWVAVILDTSQLDEDYPLGRVIVGPNTPWDLHAKLSREYLGFNINDAASVGSNMSSETIQLINNSRTNPLISVSIEPQQYEGAPDSVIATFSSDSNYYGDNHRIIFIAQDLAGAQARDTVIANVTAKNDPPILSELPDIEVVENDSITLEFGSFTSDIDDTLLTFTITALTNEDMITISPSTFASNSLGDSVTFTPQPLFSNEAMIQVVVSDEESSDSSTFKLDILRVVRPHLAVSVVQNNAFSKFLQVIVTDTVSKTVNLSMEVQNQDVSLDTIAAYTYTGDLSFESSGNYSIDIYANASVAGFDKVNAWLVNKAWNQNSDPGVMHLYCSVSSTRWSGDITDGFATVDYASNSDNDYSQYQATVINGFVWTALVSNGQTVGTISASQAQTFVDNFLTSAAAHLGF